MVAYYSSLSHAVTVQAGDDGIRFLLISGKPLEEPVAWYGPIVMNTQEQLRQAFAELQEEKSYDANRDRIG
jgi:redox-sensitive bicupin YhaK (pirin superfamily)